MCKINNDLGKMKNIRGTAAKRNGKKVRRNKYQDIIYTNKTGDCLSFCLFICSAMGGQTARLNGLKFGG